MEVRPGYKQTEVGVIPNEWLVERVHEFASVVTGGTPQVNVPAYWNGGHPWVTPTDITDERDIWASQRMISDAGLSSIRPLPANTVLVTCIASIGKNAILRNIGGCNQQINAVLPAQGNSAEFLYYIFESSKQYLIANAGMTATRIISKASFEQLKFAIPSPTEQRAIATALSDVDALLTGLDRLIAKKRDLKQAAMQQLLTGQTRLPGFSGDWEVTSFERLVRHHAGNSSLIKGKLPSAEAAGLFPAYSASGQDVWCDHFEHDGDAIVVSAVGSRCGKAFAAKGKWTAIANTHVVWPNKEKIDGRFLAYFINDENFWQKSGTGQPFVLFTKTFARSLSLPCLSEQTEIATVLSNMEAELSALEARRGKTRALKQAMMQELLTGRTRLV
jgi:type I restriction enzyme S subunit